MALSAQAQRDLIATELNMERDHDFTRYLRLAWDNRAFYRDYNADLGFLYVKRDGIQFLLSRERNRLQWRMADRNQNDRHRVMNLNDMLKAVQEDINVLLGRTDRTPPKDGGLLQIAVAAAVVGTAVRGPRVGTIGSTVAAAVIGTAGGTIAPTGTIAGSTATLASTAPNPTGTVVEIAEGGFAQEALPENDDRSYLRMRNRSTQSIWWQEGVSATMGAPSKFLAVGATVVLQDASAPTGAIWIVGPSTGQQVEVAQATLEVPES